MKSTVCQKSVQDKPSITNRATTPTLKITKNVTEIHRKSTTPMMNKPSTDTVKYLDEPQILRTSIR